MIVHVFYMTSHKVRTNYHVRRFRSNRWGNVDLRRITLQPFIATVIFRRPLCRYQYNHK